MVRLGFGSFDTQPFYARARSVGLNAIYPRTCRCSCQSYPRRFALCSERVYPKDMSDSQVDAEFSDADEMRAMAVFSPVVFRKVWEGAGRQQRFAHYTSASAALSIIEGRSVWLRNARYLDDITEVIHGIDHLIAFFNSDEADPFWNLVDHRSSNVSDRIIQLFNGWSPDMQTNTFVTCLSEHDDDEDEIGRLSMWDLYGKSGAPVALVINPQQIFSSSDVLKAYSFPVLYGNGENAFSVFRQTITAMNENSDFVRSIPDERLLAHVFHMLHSLSFCLKKPIFREQREWRVVYRPSFQPSDVITESIEIIKDVPQKVHRLPLQDVPEQGLVGIEPGTLLNRILIGPSQHQAETRRLFIERLSSLGFANAASMVCAVDAPLRR